MVSFFARHEIDKQAEGFRPGEKGYPSNGRIAWALWGGDPGFFWAKSILRKLQMGETNEKQAFAVCFKRKRSKFQEVNADAGTIENVSLVQVGVAKGHAMRVDARSLETALVALGDNLPAFITHDGALQSDRILEQVGAFTEFRIDGGKLKADFRAFDSFRVDESNRYNRLFDIAQEMPDAFGVSLVFEADLVWVDADGREWAFADKPADVSDEYPSVRFLNVSSADFVETPAANDGLFSQPQPQPQKDMDTNDQTEVAEPTEAALAEAEPATEPAVVDAAEEQNDKLAELEGKLADLSSEIENLRGQLSESEAKREALAAALGDEALEEQAAEETEPVVDVVEQFNAADPNEQRRLWAANKDELFARL